MAKPRQCQDGRSEMRHVATCIPEGKSQAHEEAPTDGRSQKPRLQTLRQLIDSWSLDHGRR